MKSSIHNLLIDEYEQREVQHSHYRNSMVHNENFNRKISHTMRVFLAPYHYKQSMTCSGFSISFCTICNKISASQAICGGRSVMVQVIQLLGLLLVYRMQENIPEFGICESE
jgi:hypothetical protein